MKSNWMLLIVGLLSVAYVLPPGNLRPALFATTLAWAQGKRTPTDASEATENSGSAASDKEGDSDDNLATQLGRLAEYYRRQGLYGFAEETVKKLL
jgi:hypothetical protein